MANPNCHECEGAGVITCPLEYGEFPHPESCPSCGGDPKSECSCPFCSEYDE